MNGRVFCVACGSYESLEGRCHCAGNLSTCDKYRGNNGEPCICWRCVRRRGEHNVLPAAVIEAAAKLGVKL